MPQLERPKLVLAALLCLLAGACFLLPGKFASELSVKRDGTFAFSYQGDIHVLALSKMAQDEAGDDKPFKALPPCPEDGDATDECSIFTEEEQRKTWEEGREAAAAKRKNDAEMMQKMLGGIDPADPRWYIVCPRAWSGSADSTTTLRLRLATSPR